jgi:putative addiction module killer protein
MTFGGGIRVYYTVQCGKIVVLLAGGNKSGQSQDIKRAEVLLENLE